MSNWCDFRRALCDQGCAGGAYCHWEEFAHSPDPVRNEVGPGAEIFCAHLKNGDHLIEVTHGYIAAATAFRRSVTDDEIESISRHPLKKHEEAPGPVDAA